MLNVLHADENSESDDWLTAYWTDFRKRFISLLSFQFRSFSPSLSLGILSNKARKIPVQRKIIFLAICLLFYFFFDILGLTRHQLHFYMTTYDIKRLEMYSNNLVDYHLITDLMPSLARTYFLNQMGDVHLSAVQSVSYDESVR